MAPLAREYPGLFFGRPTVEAVLGTAGQEVATHTYSHFYCDEPGATPEQFSSDLACARYIGAELGIQYRSIVFPRNQVKDEYLPTLTEAGVRVYRGNPRHPLYSNGHRTPGGIFGRAIRFADAWIDLTGPHDGSPAKRDRVLDVPASMFLRPWSRRFQNLEPLRLMRVKKAMTEAASRGKVFHLWWHPHNFGLNIENNLHMLESILKHYQLLCDSHGMRSLCMSDFEQNEGI
jgi:hypothetical protein